MPSGKSKRTHSKGRKTKLHKAGVRKKFSARHIDQVRERKKPGWPGFNSCNLASATTRADFYYSGCLYVRLQVWEDVRKEEGVHDGKTGPVGTTAK